MAETDTSPIPFQGTESKMVALPDGEKSKHDEMKVTPTSDKKLIQEL